MAEEAKVAQEFPEAEGAKAEEPTPTPTSGGNAAWDYGTNSSPTETMANVEKAILMKTAPALY